MTVYFIVAVFVIALSVLMSKIMRALPARWNMPFAKSVNPAGFYAVWGIFWLNLILWSVEIDNIWIRAGYFVLAYPAIHWGFQRPQKTSERQTIDDDLKDIIDTFSKLEKRLHSKVSAFARNHKWKVF